MRSALMSVVLMIAACGSAEPLSDDAGTADGSPIEPLSSDASPQCFFGPGITVCSDTCAVCIGTKTTDPCYTDGMLCVADCSECP